MKLYLLTVIGLSGIVSGDDFTACKEDNDVCYDLGETAPY